MGFCMGSSKIGFPGFQGAKQAFKETLCILAIELPAPNPVNTAIVLEYPGAIGPRFKCVESILIIFSYPASREIDICPS